MKPERVRQIIEATGLSAVVVSLLLVAYQIRQANQIAQATTTYEIVRDINQFNDMGITDPVFADLLVQLGKEGFAPSETPPRGRGHVLQFTRVPAGGGSSTLQRWAAAKPFVISGPQRSGTTTS